MWQSTIISLDDSQPKCLSISSAVPAGFFSPEEFNKNKEPTIKTKNLHYHKFPFHSLYNTLIYKILNLHMTAVNICQIGINFSSLRVAKKFLLSLR